MKKFFKVLRWIVILGLIGYLGVNVFHDRFAGSKEISQRIEKASDLTSAKMIYTGIYKSGEDDSFWEKIPFITDNRFNMIYTCDVRAGIDISEVKVNADFSHVSVTIPKAVIQDIKIDPDQIELYDQHLSLASFNNKQEMLDAEKAAEKYVKTKVDFSDLLASADEQNVDLIKNLLSGTIGDRKLTVRIEK